MTEVVQMAAFVGSYTYREGYGLPTGPQIGYAADRLADIDDRLGGRDPNSGAVRGARYQQDSALFAPAIKELADRLAAVQADNDNLRREVEALRVGRSR
jgi:hypothetical protein